MVAGWNVQMAVGIPPPGVGGFVDVAASPAVVGAVWPPNSDAANTKAIANITSVLTAAALLVESRRLVISLLLFYPCFTDTWLSRWS